MNIVSPLSKKTISYGSILTLFVVAGFAAFRAHYLFSTSHEGLLDAIYGSLIGENSLNLPDNGPLPGIVPLLVLFGYFTLPGWAAFLGVFPGLPWHYGIDNHILPGVAVIVFVAACYAIHRCAPYKHRNGLYWLLMFMWGLYGLFCYWEIEALMSI